MNSHIFISYKNEEVQYAQKLREALVEMGYDVWWDREIQTGRKWNDDIDRQLKAASCVVVLWSKRAAESKWVTHEAAHAIARDVYLPVSIEDLTIPPPFDRIQAARLVGWDGRFEFSEFAKLCERLSELIESPMKEYVVEERFEPWPAKVPRSLAWRLSQWLVANLMGVIAILLAFVVIYLVSRSLDLQIGRFNEAADGLDRKVDSAVAEIERVTRRSESTQENTRRILYPLGTATVSYAIAPDWSSELKPIFEKFNQKYENYLISGASVSLTATANIAGEEIPSDTLPYVDEDGTLIDRVCGIDVAVHFYRSPALGGEPFPVPAYPFRKSADLSVAVENEWSRVFRETLNRQVLGDHSFVPEELRKVVPLSWELPRKRLVVEHHPQEIQLAPGSWKGLSEVSSIYDLPGALLVIELRGGVPVTLDPGIGKEFFQLQKLAELSWLRIVFPNQFWMQFDCGNLTQHKLESGLAYYTIQLPGSLEEIIAATQIDRSKRPHQFRSPDFKRAPR